MKTAHLLLWSSLTLSLFGCLKPAQLSSGPKDTHTRLARLSSDPSPWQKLAATGPSRAPVSAPAQAPRKAKAKVEPEDDTPWPAPERPYAEQTRIFLEFLPMFHLIGGDVKEGPRGQTERFRLVEDLDLQPFTIGGALSITLNHKNIWTLSLEYFHQASASPGKKAQKNEVTRFDGGGRFAQGEETRSRFQWEWTRLEGGLVFASDNYHVELLVGLRYLKYSLNIRGQQGQDVTARQDGFHFYLPGVIVDLKLFGNIWGRLEYRNSFVSVPFGQLVTDGRLAFRYRGERVQLGFGGQLTTLSLIRNKDQIRQRDVNNYRELNFYGLGFYLEGRFVF